MACIGFSSDSKFLAIGNEAGVCSIYDIENGFKLIKSICLLTNQTINSLNFSSNGLLALS